MGDWIRWGILGASNFASREMGPALHAAAGGSLAALASASGERLGAFRAINPELRVHDSYDALIADPEIDAVYIPLPNHLHVEWTLKALEAGKHVLTEKPIALREADFDKLIAARDTSGKLAAEAYMIVHHPQWQHARDLFRAGEIGRLKHVQGAFSFHLTDPQNIRNRADAAGGALRDIGVYIFGSARFVTGEEPETVNARIEWENGIDSFADVAAIFPSFSYSAYVSMRMYPQQEMVFHGEQGAIRVRAPFNAPSFGDVVVELHKDGKITAERFNAVRQYDLQVAAFNRSALTGADYACPLEFSRGTQRMIDMAFASAAG
jgi:predicted dehydrogenase